MLTSNAAPAAAPSTTATSSTTSALGSTANTQLAGNFNEFLQLLTTQLQHQDPTSPLDPNQFTQELVQFASVEQQINTNTSADHADLRCSRMRQASIGAATSLGATVAVVGHDRAAGERAGKSWGYSPSQPAGMTAAISVSNSAGSGGGLHDNHGPRWPGAQTFKGWNGLEQPRDLPRPSGAYAVAMSATGANNQSVPVTTQVPRAPSPASM